MRTTMLLSTLVLIGSLTLGAEAAGRGTTGGKTPGVQPATPLSDVEAADILHMRQEEKLARDVYLHLADLWNCPTFANIAVSEQRHMDAVALLITKYGLEDPITDDTAGAFDSPEFTTMYLGFIQDGTVSLLDALNVGVQIETIDIADLTQALLETDKGDIQWVFENLLAGSNNHLAAFNRNIASGGTSCIYQSVCGMRNGRSAQATNVAARSRGRGGRGARGGTGQGARQQRRDGSCLLPSAV